MAQVAIDWKKIRPLRLSKKMEAEDLAKAAGISKRTLGRIESGEMAEGVQERTLFAICKALGIEVAVLCPEALPVPAAPASAGGKSAGKKTA